MKWQQEPVNQVNDCSSLDLGRESVGQQQQQEEDGGKESPEFKPLVRDIGGGFEPSARSTAITTGLKWC